jgi:hypothetical protein
MISGRVFVFKVTKEALDELRDAEEESIVATTGI